jgi:hypothetical protein
MCTTFQSGSRSLSTHLRSDVGKVDEPQAKALFETSTEVLGGLKKAFQDYEKKKQPRDNPARSSPAPDGVTIRRQHGNLQYSAGEWRVGHFSQ